MSGTNNSPGGTPAAPKQISSRLLNMKFMQRAAASDKSKPSSAPPTPGTEPPPKRRRTGDHIPSSNHDSTATTPGSTTTPTHKDRPTDPVAFNAERDPSTYNLKSYAGEHYETEWVLESHTPTTTNGNHQPYPSDSEASSSEGEDIWSTTNPSGSQTYGAFKKNQKLPKPPSISKSARRNAAQKHSLDDHDDLSSLSSNDSQASDSEPSSPNPYTASRTSAAHHKTNNGKSQLLGRDHNQHLDSRSDYVGLDSDTFRQPRTPSSSSRGIGQHSDKKSNHHHGEKKHRNRDGGGGNRDRSKKRKTM